MLLKAQKVPKHRVKAKQSMPAVTPGGVADVAQGI